MVGVWSATLLRQDWPMLGYSHWKLSIRILASFRLTISTDRWIGYVIECIIAKLALMTIPIKILGTT